MKKFLAVYTGSDESANAKEWATLDEATRHKREEEGMNAWIKWAEKNKASLIEGGAPLGETKRITAKGIVNTNNNLAAFTIVKAESHEAAAKLFIDHPHFKIFPGDGIEVMECLPIPGM